MKTYILSLIFLSLCFMIKAQGTQYHPEKQLSNQLALDSSISHQQLENGFQYFIKPMANLHERIDIRFLVKAGSNQEDADQYTLAHFMEHIALDAGKHVSMRMLYGSEISQELGLSRGAVNAYTAREYTEYILRIPKTEKALHFALQLVEDMMSHLEFKDEYIQNERPPFFDESEFRGGEAGLLGQSTLLDNKVLGIETERPTDYLSFIENFPKSKLIRFYRDWYRPNLMGLMILGDFEKEEVRILAQDLQERFSSIPNPTKARPRKEVKKAYHKKAPSFVTHARPTRYEDRFSSNVSYKWYMDLPQNPNLNSHQQLQEDWKQELWEHILQERLNLSKQEKSWPFQVVVTASPEVAPLSLKFEGQQKDSQVAFAQVIEIIQQMKTYGILEEELQRAKTNLLGAGIVSSQSSAYWADQIRDYFIHEKALPENKENLRKQYLLEVSKKAIELDIQQRLPLSPKHIGLIAPKGNPALQTTEKQLRAGLLKSSQQQVYPYQLPEKPESILEPDLLKQLKLREFQEIESNVSGTKAYRLANGLKILIQPNSSNKEVKKGQKRVHFQGFTSRGANCFAKKDFFSAVNAPELVLQAGVGNMKSWQLQEYLKNRGHQVNVSPYVNYAESGIRGSANPSQLEETLQLVYAYMVHPRADSLSFLTWKQETAPDRYLRRLNHNDFRTHIESALQHQDRIPKGSQRLEGIAATDAERALDIYKDLMGNVEDFTFVFVGDVETEEVLDLCRKYLGNVPSSKAYWECEAPIAFKPPKRIKNNTWKAHEKMTNSLVNLTFSTSIPPKDDHWQAETQLTFLASLLDVLLMKKMRIESEEGGPYAVFTSYKRNPLHQYNQVIIEYSAKPQDIPRLQQQVLTAIEEIKQEPVSKDMLDAVVTELLPSLKESNSRRLEKLLAHEKYQYQVPSAQKEEKFILSLTPEDIQQIANYYLKETPQIFQLIPEK